MTGRILIPLAALAVLLTGAALSHGQGSGEAECRYGIDLRARKATEPEFTKETRKFGVEVYTFGQGGDALHLSEVGSVAVVPGKLFKAEDKWKEPLWQHGLTLNVRPVGEKDWDKGKKIGLEVYKDEMNGDLIYINEKGMLATVPAKYAVATDKGKPKNPTYKHGLELKVRKAGEKDWDKSKRVVVEVFRDENNGNLLYISDSGSFAVVPDKLASKSDSGKDPTFQHGLDLPARRQDEKEFTKDTRTFGVEVFIDENTGNQVYVSETGALAVVPGKFAKATEQGQTRPPELRRGVNLRVRKVGQREFSTDSPRFGLEVYSDGNNGNLIYLTETGEFAVASPRTE